MSELGAQRFPEGIPGDILHSQQLIESIQMLLRDSIDRLGADFEDGLQAEGAEDELDGPFLEGQLESCVNALDANQDAQGNEADHIGE